MEAARPATADDVATIAWLCRTALHEMAEARGGWVFTRREARGEPLEAGLQAVLDDPDAALWVGTVADVVVGYAATHLEQLRDGELLAVIDDLFVEEGARNVGVGEALGTVAVAWAVGRGAAGVDAMALPGDRATKNFFETEGFTARLLVMHHRLRTAP